MRTRVTLSTSALILTLLIGLSGPAVAASPPPRHMVRPGDTLSALADEYATTVPAIKVANLLPDSDTLPVGRVLVMPRASEPLIPIEVGPFDTLAGLARRYHTSVQVLRELNEMRPAERLIVGQDLLVRPWPPEPSLALPPGPLTRVQIRPAVARQGTTLLVRVHSSRPLSVSIRFGQQLISLRAGRPNHYWGLVAVHALAEPGTAHLEIRWQDEKGQTGKVGWPVEVVAGGYGSYNVVLPPEKSSLLDPRLIRAEAERLAALWTTADSGPAWSGRFRWPLPKEAPTTAPFGQRRSYNGGPVTSFHTGQDFAAPEGTPVVAPAAGTVVLAEPLQVRGNAVIIDHGAGLFTGYWHLSKIAVKVGQRVEPGQLLGRVGTTGLSTGAHLHWEMRLHGVAVDPLQWTRQTFP